MDVRFCVQSEHKAEKDLCPKSAKTDHAVPVSRMARIADLTCPPVPKLMGFCAIYHIARPAPAVRGGLKRWKPRGSTSGLARCAFFPTSMTVRSFGSNGSKPLRASTPSESSPLVILRVPFHPGPRSR